MIELGSSICAELSTNYRAFNNNINEYYTETVHMPLARDRSRRSLRASWDVDARGTTCSEFPTSPVVSARVQRPPERLQYNTALPYRPTVTTL